MTETTNPGSADTLTPVQVQITGDTTAGLPAYAERRLREAFEDSHLPVLHARIRVTRYADRSIEQPVLAEANLDVDGRFVRAQLSARTAQEAVDLLHDRLRHRLQHLVQRSDGGWEDRRGRRTAVEEHEWRHGDERTHRPAYFPRPAEEREIVRHKSVTPARCTLDDAAADMTDLGFDFHLFTELGTRQDSVLYRAGPTGYRLAQVHLQPADQLAPHTVPVTVHTQAAPSLSVAEAVDRMTAWEEPFLFFLDRDRDRGAVLYHRYDGHYGLIVPAEATPSEEERS